MRPRLTAAAAASTLVMDAIMSRAALALPGCVAVLALGACGSDLPGSDAEVVEGEGVRILIAEQPPEGTDDLVSVDPVVDDTTGCLVDEHGHPLAFPEGTRISGTPQDWTLALPNGIQVRPGGTVRGGSEDDQSMDYVDDLPDDCGPPPWHVFYSFP